VPPFDRDLTDPTPAAVEQAMAEAVASANLRCSVGVMPYDGAAHRRFATAELATSPEGVALWLSDKGRVDQFPPTPRATLLGVAWRTTPMGRRLVRIVGRRIEPFKEGPRNRFGPPWRSWPALCLLDPDHVVLRTLAGGKPEAIAICGCGEVGPPDKLGWAVGRCGPCHDHLEEHGTPLAAGAGPPALRTEGQLIDVAFVPSGRTVAAAEWVAPRDPVKVAVWDRQTGACRSDHATSGGGAQLVEPADVGDGVALTSGWCAFWAREGHQEPVFSRVGPSKSATDSLAFQGTHAAAVCYDGEAWRCDLTARGSWEQCWPVRRDTRNIIFFTMALAPGGAKAALGRTQCAVELVDWPGGGEGPTLRPALPEEQIERQRVYAIAFSPDGKLLAAGAGRSGFVDDPREEWFGRGGGLYLYDAVKGEPLASFPAPNDDYTAVAFSPDGALLFAGSTDCAIHVVDVATRQEMAVLSGHVGGVNALCFSPDGQTLASAGGDGLVRLWPWRQLLARPEAPTPAAPAPRRRRKKGA
jgi:WD40 repeat protein